MRFVVSTCRTSYDYKDVTISVESTEYTPLEAVFMAAHESTGWELRDLCIEDEEIRFSPALGYVKRYSVRNKRNSDLRPIWIDKYAEKATSNL